MITKKLRSCFCLALQFVLPLWVPAIAAAKATVRVLDANGYQTDSFTGANAITLRPDVLYYIIEP